MSFVAPQGFEEHAEENLYYHPELRASIAPAHQEGAAFKELVEEFTEANLLAEGVALTERTLKVVDGRETLFVKGNRLDAEYPQIIVITAFPTQSGCAQLTAIYPADTPSTVQQQIDAAVLNATYND